MHRIIYRNAKRAIDQCPERWCVAWSPTDSGWTVFNPLNGCPKGMIPEFFVVDRFAVPLNDDALGVAISIRRALA